MRIGLTGGIGAGKSTVSAAFDECGGIIVDGDVIAREVVEPGTEGLASLVDAFGDDILLPDGALNRPALAAKAFVDDEKRQLLNGIVHPLVARRREEVIAAVSEDAVVVEDIPLLVETGLAPMFPLVVVVHADEETRVERLIKRGMDETDARARIAAQASEEQRRAIADVLLDNSGSQGELVERAREIWYQRVLPFAHNIRTRETVRVPPIVVPYDPAWADDARRIVNRLTMACGHRALRVDHIGSTAVEGMDAKDVIDIQVTVESLAVADELVGALTEVGYPANRSTSPATLPHAGRPVAVAQANSRRSRSRASGQCPHSGERMAESAVRAVVRRLAEGQSRVQRGLSRGQAAGAAPHAGLRRGEGAVVPRRLPAGQGMGGHHGWRP